MLNTSLSLWEHINLYNWTIMIGAVWALLVNRSFSEITGETWAHGKCCTIQKHLKSVFWKKLHRKNLKVIYALKFFWKRNAFKRLNCSYCFRAIRAYWYGLEQILVITVVNAGEKKFHVVLTIPSCFEDVWNNVQVFLEYWHRVK